MTHLTPHTPLARYIGYLHQHMTQVDTTSVETVGDHSEYSENPAMATEITQSLRSLEISLSRYFREVP